MKSLREQKQKRFIKNPKKWLITGGIVAAVLLVVGGAWLTWKLRSDAAVRQQANAAAAGDQAPAKAAASQQTPANSDTSTSKDDAAKNNPAPSTPSTPTPAQKKSVTPVLTSAGYTNGSKQQVEVDAYVPGIFENGGTCTLTATQGSQKVTATSQGYQNVSQTSCHNFVVDRGKFPAGGSWTIIVTYSSSTAEGTSQNYKMDL